MPEVLDLAQLSSVRAISERILQRYPQPSVDLLINDAGVMAIPKRQLTPDGYERQFATNYLGPFALTALLFRAMKQQAGSRIVIVSSTASRMGKIDFENLQSEHRYSPMWGAYAQSKLADSIFAIELQRLLTAVHSPVIVTAASRLCDHEPTNQWSWRDGSSASHAHRDECTQAISFAGCVPRSPTYPLCRDRPGRHPRRLLWAEWLSRTEGGSRHGQNAPMALDPAIARRLWLVSEQLTGIEFHLA